MKVYIAGPMKGYPRFNFDMFYQAEAVLQHLGYEVVNPARVDEENGFNPDRDEVTPKMSEQFARRDFELIAGVETVVLLPGWEWSVGCKTEFWLARWLGKKLLPIEALMEKDQMLIAD